MLASDGTSLTRHQLICGYKINKDPVLSQQSVNPVSALSNKDNVSVGNASRNLSRLTANCIVWLCVCYSVRDAKAKHLYARAAGYKEGLRCLFPRNQTKEGKELIWKCD